MATKKQLAEQLFALVKEVLTEMEITYNVEESPYTVRFDYRGQDMNHRMYVEIFEELSILQAIELLPFDVEPGKGTEMMEAVNRINNAIRVGRFQYDMKDTVVYSIQQLFENSILSREVVQSMVYRVASMCEDFDDRLVAINKGYLKAADIMQGLV